MDIIELEERLIASGFKLEQAREIVRIIAFDDVDTMTHVDGHRLEQALRAEMKRLEDRVDVRFTSLDAKIDAMKRKLVITAWTIGGVAVGILSAIKYLG